MSRSSVLINGCSPQRPAVAELSIEFQGARPEAAVQTSENYAALILFSCVIPHTASQSKDEDFSPGVTFPMISNQLTLRSQDRPTIMPSPPSQVTAPEYRFASLTVQ